MRSGASGVHRWSSPSQPGPAQTRPAQTSQVAKLSQARCSTWHLGVLKLLSPSKMKRKCLDWPTAPCCACAAP